MDNTIPTDPNVTQPQAPQVPPAPVTPPSQSAPAGGDEDVIIGKYRIKVIRDACIGAASCVAVAGATFQLDSANKAVVQKGSQDVPDTILMAAQSCPTKAIVVYDLETNQQVWPV